MDEPPSNSLLNILSDQSLLYFLTTTLLLVFSAWTSAVEAAFFSLKTDEVERFRSSSNKKERNVAALLADPRLLLTVLTACKYGMLLAAATLSVTSFSWRGAIIPGDLTLILWILLLTVGFGLFGVILSKIYGKNHPVAVSVTNGGICRGLILLLKPVAAPILKMSQGVERILAAKFEQASVEELTHALQLATIDNEPVEGEREILEGIVNFGTLRVKQVMRQRSEISYTDLSLDYHQLIDFIRRSGYSRIPVCDGSIDKVRGMLYVKDLLPFLDEAANFDWRKLMRSGYFVQETKKIDFLLKDFQEKRVHIAMVVNQQGQVSGLITLEDVIEEIIGDINDEFDEVGSRYHRLDEHTFLFDGKTSVHELCRVMDINASIFHPLRGINESLGGVLLQVNKRLPDVGEKIAIGPLTFTVEAVDLKRIKKIRVEAHEPKIQ